MKTLIAIVVLLVLWILAIGRRLHLHRLALVCLESENKRLQAENAWLRGHNPNADAEASNFVDNNVAIEFALQCGYLAAFVSHGDAKEDRKLREDALCRALEYYRKHLPDRLAAANH